MSDKDDKQREQERQRERDMDAEIFGKTMGFVYAKDSKDFDDVTTLDHAHAPGLNKEEDYQATVRFSSSKAMAQSGQRMQHPTQPTPPQAAKPTPPQAAKPTPPQAAKPTPPQAAKPTPPQAAKPTPPQAAKPTPPQAAKPTPPQAAKPAAPVPEVPKKSEGTEPVELDAALSLDDLDQFLLPDTELGEAGGTPKPAAAQTEASPAEATEPKLAAEELGALDFSELEESLLEEADESLTAPAKSETGEDEDLLAVLDELAHETAELESDEFLEGEGPKKTAAGELPDLDLETGDFTMSQENEFLLGETAAATETEKILLTEQDELPETAADLEGNEFLLVEEPAPAITEESLSNEPPFQTQYDESGEELAEFETTISEKSTVVEEPGEFITTMPENLTEAPSPEPVAAQPAAKPRGSGFAVFLGLLGIAAAGGVGWLTLQTMDRIDQLEARIAALSGPAKTDSVNARQDQSIDSLKAQTADLEQQLGNLTGVVSELSTKNRSRNTRRTPRPAKPKPAPKQSAAPAAAGSQSAATGSDWVVNLTSVASETAALDEVQRLKELGVDAEAVRVEIDGKPWYRIRAGNFPTEEEAKARSEELAQQLGIQDTWISHR